MAIFKLKFISNFYKALMAMVCLLAFACSSKPPENIKHPGQLIYLGYKDTYASCARCHGKEGQGGSKAPAIRNCIKKLGPEKVRDYILNGKGLDKKDAMPGFADDLTPEDVDQLIDFLTLWAQPDSLADTTQQKNVAGFKQKKQENQNMLKEGDQAPDFELPDENGNPVRLSDFRGKKVVLYFYPKDNTSGCTKEAINFRDQYAQFQKLNAVILGVSKDSPKSHQNFKSKYDLPFPLLADESTQVMQKYGVWQEKSMYGRKYMGTVRTTFLIDEHGVIQKIWPKVKVTGHEKQVLSALGGS
ncbi:MAG: thioredoxin-dependent thiol peroxidase [Calditrichaeota bacterium]|nr:MAG: thioredoxin-dependent thiol peroxidase [Calditrichota bacterium]